ncbi:MAG: hypothetical protein LC112_13990 [Flavobacteriales bacterium]|nr:hypothetical protein [Flavobacteriales bacterium]
MANEILLIPSGPKNLATIFPGVNFSNVAEYYIEALDAGGNTIVTTPKFQTSCCCNDDKIRLHFLNYLGQFDAVNFLKPRVVHDVSAKDYQKGLPNILAKKDTGTERFDLRSNDTYETRTSCYDEDAMKWLQELIDSPKVFIEWKGIQNQQDDFIPVVITSRKFDKLKNVNEFRYDFIIEFKLSNEYLIIRN